MTDPLVKALESIATTLQAQTGMIELLVTPQMQLRTDASREYDRGYENAMTDVVDQAALMASRVIELFPRIEELEIRSALAEALGMELPITPEEPDPGRDWSHVEGHLFSSTGKWKYRVWLDYSGLRRRGVSGEGPSGWHFDGSAMVKLALMYATDGNRSGVSMREIPTGWRLFVQNPPQGYPVYAIGGVPDDRPDADATKLDEIRALVDTAFDGSGDGEDVLRGIREVLGR